MAMISADVCIAAADMLEQLEEYAETLHDLQTAKIAKIQVQGLSEIEAPDGTITECRSFGQALRFDLSPAVAEWLAVACREKIANIEAELATLGVATAARGEADANV